MVEFLSEMTKIIQWINIHVFGKLFLEMAAIFVDLLQNKRLI
ncbi:hypothetical protein SAMN05518848_11329 [Paenibacillus sp. PDC88]|nr:hypothetical protein SAMN05518848_11329 [Paenibacillus sp. PDC88]SGI66432.1 Uncharacterised protein [Mycobacterium tuberculosis]